MSNLTQNTKTHTAMVDGKEMEASRAAEIHEVRVIFDKLKKTLKTIALYRHNTERYGEYLEPVHSSMADFLARKNSLQLRLDAMSYKFRSHEVFTDESRENNIVYPFFQAGIRLLIFKAGLSPDELLRFLNLCFTTDDKGGKRGGDVVTRLWKEEFESIEYVVVEGFKAVPDEDIEEVEVEVEKVVAYLYRQLQSNSDDYMRFARVSIGDLDLELNDVDSIRGAVISGVTATAADRARVQTSLETEDERLLQKLVTVFFQLLELDTTEQTFEDVAEGFVQLLDAMLLQENFTALHQIRKRFKLSQQKKHLTPATLDLVQRCADRFNGKVGDGQRIQTVGSILNRGIVKDPEGLKLYLHSLGTDAVLPILDMLETLELPQNRRIICEVLVELGGGVHSVFSSRLTNAPSNMVKDMLYIIDKIDPAEKFTLFAQVLEHPNAILRLETLSIIGKNPTEDCFAQLQKVVEEHEDSQMRAQAFRNLPNFDAEWSVPVLLAAVKNPKWEDVPEPEKKAIFTALGQMQDPQTQAVLMDCFSSKSGMFAKKGIDELKMLAVIGLEAAPSMQSIQALATIAQDLKKHPKEICDAALAAAIQMKARILGG
ncbi:MAG: HEAT repeat domain-containing protein [Deltaproteobacteria bacterium]|nr:HEAT repeat domain-containing protein [Deltaproteobacteria bacterium]